MAMEQTTCAHAGCNCALDGGDAVEQRGQTFCSRGCADGDGCQHPGCNCAAHESSL